MHFSYSDNRQMAKGRQSDQTIEIFPYGARRGKRVPTHIGGVPGRRRHVQMFCIERRRSGRVVGRFESHR